MASPRDIRRRIRGVKNIKQVTRAMNMIATARLRRAQAKAESARPYAERISEILQDVRAAGGGAQHPLMAQRSDDALALVLITSDRGLCGAFNARLPRSGAVSGRTDRASRPDHGGTKGTRYFERRGVTMDAAFRTTFARRAAGGNRRDQQAR